MDRAGFWQRSEHPYEQEYESELRRYAADSDSRRDKSARSRDEERKIEELEVRYRQQQQQQQQQRGRDLTWREELNFGTRRLRESPEPDVRRVRVLDSLSPEPGLIISPESSPYAADPGYQSRSQSFEMQGAFWKRSSSPANLLDDQFLEYHRSSRSEERGHQHPRSPSNDRSRYRSRSGERHRYSSRSPSRERSRHRSRSPSEDRRRGRRRAYSRSPDRKGYPHRRSGNREHERDQHTSGYHSSKGLPEIRSKSRENKEKTPQPSNKPSPLILLRNLPATATRGDIEVSTRGFQTREILFFKGKESGQSRGICSVEFANQADATSWLSQNSDSFFIQGEKISLDYTAVRGRDGDWTCSKCKASNFRNRLICFVCNQPQYEYEELQQGSRPMELAPPASVLILRGLKVTTGEEAVRLALSSISVHPVRDVRLIKDKVTKQSRGFCFLEFMNVSEATETLDSIFEQDPAFFVEGVRTIANFARGNFSSSHKFLNQAAQSAIEQGGWSSQADPIQGAGRTGESEYSSNPVQYSSTETAATASQYQYDSTCGYYYDSVSGLYYDPTTQYHFDTVYQKYCYYDTTQSKYLFLQPQPQLQPLIQPLIEPQDAQTEMMTGAATETENTDISKLREKKKTDLLDNFSTSNVKQARKIAKDMERWAQKQNTTKSYKPIATPHPQENETNAPPPDLSGDFTLGPISINLEQRSSAGTGITNSSGQLDFSQLAPTPAQNVVSTSAPVLSFDAEPLYTDWERIACLLCKRQFQSKDQLIKHQQLSDLHKQNLQKTRY